MTPARLLRSLLVVLVVLVSHGCARPEPPTILLISFDGFRWDYLQKYPTPEIQQLLARGAHAEALIPPFPSKTFPSHYTAVTGLYPEHHGIVANTMRDPVMNARFSLADRKAVVDERWWGGEPIWVTAETQGRVTAALFWPGSEGPIRGVRPRYWSLNDDALSHEARVETVLGWLDKPPAERPTFMAAYFSDTDTAGHKDGPDSAAVRAAVERLDRMLGRLRRGLEQRELWDRINIILTSDHGMTEVSRQRMIFLDDYLDPDTLDIVDRSPVLMMSARDGDNERVYQQLANVHPRLHVYRKGDIPARLHFQASARITPLVGIADEGWTVSLHSVREPLGPDGELASRGVHGYDNTLPSMRGILVAAGPAFRKGAVIPPVENVNLYEMMCRILGLTPARNDGSLEATRNLLVAP